MSENLWGLSWAHQDMIRVSVGIEHIDDIKEDFEQALAAAAAAK